MIAGYVQWLSEIPIVPRYPFRNSLRRELYFQNPDVWSLSLFLEKYPDTDGPGPIVGRGTSGKYARQEHQDLIWSLKRNLYYSDILNRIMRINQNNFFLLYCLYRLNRLKDIGCMRRSYEDNISRKEYIRMKMFGLIFFLGKRIGTSTHYMNYSVRPRIIHQFMMYVSNKMCSGDKIEHFGFQTGEMRKHYRFRFLHGNKRDCMPAFRINFLRRSEILMNSPKELQFAIRLRRFTNLIRVETGNECRLPTYVFNGKDLPSTLHPNSIAFVRNVSKMLFFHFTKQSVFKHEFMHECCMREFVRIILGFVIGTSQAKIESAVVELFAGVFPRFSSREAPECFSIVFSLLERCDSLDPEFFKQEVDKMLAESIASPILDHSYIRNERYLLKMVRSPIQNILLFVIYWHKRHVSNWGFLFQLSYYLSAIQEMI
jgi:hypothetical protein